MSHPQAKHIRRELTPQEQARVLETRRLVEGEKDEILSLAKAYKSKYDAAHAAFEDTLKMLKAERLRQGLSLEDIQQRVGIETPNLLKLEEETGSNPTVELLTLYADALGKKLFVVVAER